MKALSVKQPWADAIAHGEKRTENRSRPAPAKHIGTRILLHSSGAPDRHAVLPASFDIGRLYGVVPLGARGAILGVATLASCHRSGDGCSDNCATWGEAQAFHWKLADIVALPEPVPAKGALGFWQPTPDVLDAVQRQIEVTR
jgi:hypothetical protein